MFSVAPIDDPCARALYHYIATGTTLPAHMYRERGSGQTVPEIEKYIEEKLKGKNYERPDLRGLVKKTTFFVNFSQMAEPPPHRASLKLVKI